MASSISPSLTQREDVVLTARLPRVGSGVFEIGFWIPEQGRAGLRRCLRGLSCGV